MSSAETRAGLIEAATRAFAEDGVQAASMVEITRQAGQRNRGAVHYHFGGRDGLLVAVLDQCADFLAEREGELLALARTRPATDVASVIEAIVRPTVELAETGWVGRCFLVIVGELVDQDPSTQSEQVLQALARTGGYDVYELLEKRMPPLDEELHNERVALVTTFILGSVARRARGMDAEGGRIQLGVERFIAHLVVLATALVSAPSFDDES